MANDESLGASFSIDVTDLKTGLAQANRLIRESESEFKSAAAGMDDWQKSEEGINKKIKSLNDITEIQKKKVDALKEQYQQLIKNGLDPTSKEAVELRTKINKEEAALKSNETELKKQKEALKNVGKETKEAGKSFETFAKIAKGAAKAAATAIGAVATAAVAVGKKMIDVAKQTAEAGDEIDKVSQRMGLSAEAYQKWDYVLSQSGVDINSMQTGLKTLTNQIGEATKGSEDAAERFAQLGISVNDLKKMSREEVFAATIKSLQGMADGTERAALANKLFGKSGQEITPLLNQSAKSTEQLMKKAEELGFIMSNEAVKASADFKDALDTLSKTATGLKNKIGAELLPSLMQGMEGLTDILANNVEQGAEKINVAIFDLIGNILPNLVNLIQGMLPSLSIATTSILDGLLKILPTLISSVIEFVFKDLVPAILNMLPTIVTAVIDIAIAVINGVAEMLPMLIETIVEVVPLLIAALLENIPNLLDAAIKLLFAVVDAVPYLVNGLLDALPTVIDTLIDFLINNIPMILNAAIKLLMAIVKAIPKINTQIGKTIPTIITGIVKGILNGVPKLADAGLNLIKGLWNGINNAKSWLLSQISGFVDGVVGGIKNFFGIHSPSKRIEDEVGIFAGQAVGTGMMKSLSGVLKNVGVFGKKVTAGLSDAINPDIGDINARVNASVKTRRATSTGTAPTEEEKRSKTVIINQTNNYSKAHSRYELYKAKQETAAAVRLAMAGG